MFGLNEALTGTGVSMYIIGTGNPLHTDTIKHIDCQSFVGGDLDDKLGYSTMLTGMICGIAPDVKVYAVKSISDDGKTDYGTIVSSVLWAIAKKADIILVPPVLDDNVTVLNDVFKKGRENNVFVFSNDKGEAASLYKDVFFVSSNHSDRFSVSFVSDNRICLNMPDNIELCTTYKRDCYAKPSADISSLSILGGITSLLMEHTVLDGGILKIDEFKDKINSLIR